MYNKVEKLMDENGVTQYKLSQDTGVPQSTLSDWKRGLYTPKVDKLKKIADYFGVPLEYFLEE